MRSSAVRRRSAVRLRLKRNASASCGASIVGDVSKKKLRQQEKEAADKAARDYEAKRNPQDVKQENLPLSGIAERPYCKGRAYQADRYRKQSGSEETEE